MILPGEDACTGTMLVGLQAAPASHPEQGLRVRCDSRSDKAAHKTLERNGVAAWLGTVEDNWDMGFHFLSCS